MNFEPENEPNEAPEQVFKERLTYAAELTKRIGLVLTACENYSGAYEPAMNLRAFLLPVIKDELQPQINGLRKAYNTFISRLPYPVMNIPTRQHRPNNNYGTSIPLSLRRFMRPEQEEVKSFMGPHKKQDLVWDDFPSTVREILLNYYASGTCVQTLEVRQLAFNVFARAEVEAIIRCASKHNLLLLTGSTVATGGMSLYGQEGENDAEF